MPPKGGPKTKPFKPPRPSAGKSSTATAASRRVSAGSTKAPKSKGKAKARELEPENSGIVIDDDDDPFASSDPEPQADSEGEEAEQEHEMEDPDIPEITIEPELLTRILHEFFSADGGVRISKDASMAVGKYMHTFVQEAICRAAAENREEAEKNGGLGGNDMFLEVEDLEKLAGQLLLDF